MKITSMLSNGFMSTRTQKINQYIEIVVSTDQRLNFMAQDTRQTIASALRKRYTKVGISIVNNMEDLENLVAKKPDLVVPGMRHVLLDPSKGFEASPKVWLSTYLDQNNIAFTGSDRNAITLQANKQASKQAVINAGLQSTAYFIAKLGQPVPNHQLTYPLFVKPNNRGGGVGIDEQSVVRSDVDLKAKIQSIHSSFSTNALVEEYLPGREFSVAVVRQPYSNELLAMPIEIAAPTDGNGHSFLSEAVKKADTEMVLKVNDAALKNSINSLAIGVFKALGAQDYGRIDVRLDAAGNPSFIEANLHAGLSTHGYLARCFYLNEQISYADMILAIVALGLERSQPAYIQTPQAELELMAADLATTLPIA